MSKPYGPALWEFIPLDYVASYTDLMNAFGANGAAGDSHYRQHGQFEGRLITFDSLEYIASYPDLISALGANADTGATHYIQAGRFEGRTDSFDGLEYIASYGDLIDAFKGDVAAHAYPDFGNYGCSVGSGHFIQHGHSEGRTVSFDSAQYLAKYADLQAAFVADTQLATQHYIISGHTEGRTDDPI